jgi:predicted acylesterase/phospholipase RssA
MKKIGLALSGGGFRATLYHLGLVRFLRDAGLLQQVTHITSVSGGSIMAAHLALNWDLYTGTSTAFDHAAQKLLAFARLDVRNRILRRFPLAFLLRGPRRLLGWSNRRLTRTGLLEDHYEKHLYGDRSLFELPEWPQLHILATNLSEGCLCSFNRDGLWMMQEKAGRSQIDRIRVGLMTVAMAVTASSAFPGFFPPLELTGQDVGARGGEFGRQAYTDGGVFDNLGVRMFRWLTPLLKEDMALDGVLVSDVGSRILIQTSQAGGLVRTALRSTDILMDRVWQLENENFQDTFGFVFARITDVASSHEDSTAMHTEVQRQVANIRTDLDAFSPLEISCLIRQGYCIGRKACRSRTDLFGTDLPSNPPWDPIPPADIPQNAPRASRHDEPTKDQNAPPASQLDESIQAQNAPPASQLDEPNQAINPNTIMARQLQASASRRIWGSLFSMKDWTSFAYVPLILLLLLVPYYLLDSYQQSRRLSRLIDSISHGSPDFEVMSQLMRAPMRSFKGGAAEDEAKLDPLDYTGFHILQDSRIIDLRRWNPTGTGTTDTTSLVYGYRRLKVQKTGKKGNEVFRVLTMATHPDSQFRFPPQRYQPQLRRMMVESPTAQEKKCQFEVSVDLSKATAGQVVDLIYENYSPGVYVQRGDVSTTISFRSEFDAAEVTRWILLPSGREYGSFEILRYETGKPATAEIVKGYTEYLADDSSIIAYKLASVKAGYTFEVTWFYK